MDLFRNHPSLCSLFLSTLEEWGAESVDWGLLKDEAFVDIFLRRLNVTDTVEEEASVQACALLMQPSPGGLLAAGTLHRQKALSTGELNDFVEFTLSGSAQRWRPLSWPELGCVLEEVLFLPLQREVARDLACLMARGWLPSAHQTRFFRRVWRTCRIPLEQKKQFFRWLYGQHSWPELPKAPSSFPGEIFSLKVAYRLSSAPTPYSTRRRGVSSGSRERRLIG